jgi:hypothetical protein
MKAVPTLTQKPYKNPLEAALVAGVTQRCVNNWCHRYPGLAIRIGGRWRINPAAFDRLMRGLPVGVDHE